MVTTRSLLKRRSERVESQNNSNEDDVQAPRRARSTSSKSTTRLKSPSLVRRRRSATLEGQKLGGESSPPKSLHLTPLNTRVSSPTPSFMSDDKSMDYMTPKMMSEASFSRLKRRMSDSKNAFRSSQMEEIEDVLLFKEQPRQFLFLFMVLLLFIYYNFTHDSNDIEKNIRSALFAGSFVFLLYCFLQTRDGLLVRPHPGLWRVVHGTGVLYLVLLAALSVQNTKGGKAALRVLFPEIDAQAPPAMAPMECDINPKALYQSITSIWFLAHVVGWWGKMCMFRDLHFCWVISVSFEILELILQFMIPHFQECWWDALFMDLLGANLIGMLLGRLTLNILESKEYDWGKKSGFVRRALGQLSPFSWSRYHWEVFSSLKRFGQVTFVIIICLMAELNAFFLLRTLNIPKESNFNKYRLLLIFLLGIPTTSEYYEFISDPNCWRVGQNAWLMCSIVCFETLVWVKFFPEILLYSKPLPLDVIVPLVLFGAMFSMWLISFFWRQYQEQVLPPLNPRITLGRR